MNSLTAVIPEFMAGFCSTDIFAGIVSLLGIKLKMLPKDNGQMSRIATSPHRRHGIHFGAFLRSSLTRTTARISQLAVILIFTILRNTELMINPPS